MLVALQTAMKDAIQYIKTNWKDGKSLKEIANRFGVDPGNLDRAFRSSEGMTVTRYVDEQRRRYVLKAIAENKMLGYEIGAALGFKTDRAFYQWVKRAFGTSFRELCLSRKSNDSSAQSHRYAHDKK